MTNAPHNLFRSAKYHASGTGATAALYTDLAGMDTMLTKFNDITAMKPELLLKLRTALGL